MSKRRSSIMKSAPVLGLRLENENVLNSLTGDPVAVEDFIAAIKSQPSIVSVMKHISFDGIRSKYRSGKIGRQDCSEILSAVLANSNSTVAVSTDAEGCPCEHIVEKQSVALNIEYNTTLSTIHIGLMDADDPRVRMAPENKLMVRSDTDIEELVKTYATAKSITDKLCIGSLFDYVERAVLKAKQKEIQLLEEAIEEFIGQTKTMASIVMASEDRMLEALREAEKQQFVSSVMSSGGGGKATRRGSVMKDIAKALDAAGGDSSLPENTPARLALKLNELQQRALEAEKECKHYEEMEELLEEDPNAEICPPPKDSNSTRSDWRRRIDSTLALKRAENERQRQQNQIMHNVSVALRASCDGSGQKLVIQRDHIRNSNRAAGSD